MYITWIIIFFYVLVRGNPFHLCVLLNSKINIIVLILVKQGLMACDRGGVNDLVEGLMV